MESLRRVLLEGPPAIRILLAVFFVMAVVVQPVSAALFAWDGSAVGLWSDEGEWNSIGCTHTLCYPQTEDDDAIIDEEQVIEIEFTQNLDIDDLTIDVLGEEAGITFTTDGPTAYVLTADTVTITSNVVTMEALAGIVAEGADPCEQ